MPTVSYSSNGKAINTGPLQNVPTQVKNPVPSSLAFPIHLEKQPYWMSFSFYAYQMPSLKQQNIYFQDQGTIRLPVPNMLKDSQHVTYTEEALGLTAGAAVNQLQRGDTSSFQSTFGTGVNAVIAGGAANLAERAANAAGKLGSATLQTQGIALNPFLSVMFKSPAFKEYAMSWKLAPTNEQESRRVNQIINIFRGNMLPGMSDALGGTILTYPNICQILLSVNNEDYMTYAFKPAVIKSFDVNFTPAGQPSFFGSTDAPTEVEISITFMEIEYWLSSDYGLDRNMGPLAGEAIKIVNNIADKLGFK